MMTSHTMRELTKRQGRVTTTTTLTGCRLKAATQKGDMDQWSLLEAAAVGNNNDDDELIKYGSNEGGVETKSESIIMETTTTSDAPPHVNNVINQNHPPRKKQKLQNGNSSSTCRPSLPNKVTFDPIRKLFRLRKSKGKTLAAGGFGVSIRLSPEELAVEEEQGEEGVEQEIKQQQTHVKADNDVSIRITNDNGKSSTTDIMNGHSKGETTDLNGSRPPLHSNTDEYTEKKNTTKPIIRKEFLFVEEVIFLYERGLMDVYDENNIRLNDTPYLIYNFLERLDMSLPLYLVYAHARQQSYRVVRHGTTIRQEILKEMEQLKQKWATTTAEASPVAAPALAAAPSAAEPVTESNVEITGTMKAVSDISVSEGGPSAQRQDGTKEEEREHRVRAQSDTTSPDGMPLLSRSMKLLEQRLRDEVAPPPKAAFLSSSSSSSSTSAFTSNNEDNDRGLLPPLAWDVYLPNATFQRSRPGLPAFSILVTHYAAVAGAASRCAAGCFKRDAAADSNGTCSASSSSSSFLSFSQMQALALANRPVPVKIATVSDSGTVVVFGVFAPSFGDCDDTDNDDDAHSLVPSIVVKDHR